MFEPTKMFDGMFAKVQPGLCRLTMKGGIAVHCSDNKYKTYNIEKNTLTNVTNFCLNVGDEMFFVIPTNKVGLGDIILVDGKPKCVIESDKKTIKVIDYETAEIKTILPERHIFMGNVYFYGKIVSMFGNVMKGGNGLQGLMKMSIMSQMMGGNSIFGGSATTPSGMGGMGNMLAPMMMMGMFGHGSNPFDDLLGEMTFSFDTAGVEEDDDDEDEKPAKRIKAAKKSKKAAEDEDEDEEE